MFTYHCFRCFRPKIFIQASWFISTLLIAVLLIGSLLFFDRLYTCVTFELLACTLFLMSFLKRQSWLHTFYFMYLVILIPFFIVNGLLTGMGLNSPIVWYNDSENMGLRLITIPAEDIFYGMMLLVLNVWLFEKFRKRNDTKAHPRISL